MTQFRPGGFQILPTVIKNLIIINAIMAFAQFVFGNMGINLTDYLGLHYWKSEYFGVWQFVTHMFMHSTESLSHLFSNMFALWIFGTMLENFWGPKRFLAFYLLCGIGAAALHMGVLAYGYMQVENAFYAYQQNPTVEGLGTFIKSYGYSSDFLNEVYRVWTLHPNADLSQEAVSGMNKIIYGFIDDDGQYQNGVFDAFSIGASGAVYGILFGLGYLFPNALIYIYFLVPVKVKYIVALYAVLEFVAGVENSAGDNVAHLAHLSGMLVAFILLRIWKEKSVNHF